jgi:hypothetical protein
MKRLTLATTLASTHRYVGRVPDNPRSLTEQSA